MKKVGEKSQIKRSANSDKKCFLQNVGSGDVNETVELTGGVFNETSDERTRREVASDLYSGKFRTTCLIPSLVMLINTYVTLKNYVFPIDGVFLREERSAGKYVCYCA